MPHEGELPVISVALIGPDGAGKSTICRLLPAEMLPAPVKTIYMGVNLEASALMLPTTRLALAIKRRRGGRPDMAASHGTPPAGVRPTRGGAIEALRLTLWLAEEWFRQLVALGHRLRGRIVVFDRHFLADYYHSDVARRTGTAPGVPDRPRGARVHGFLLRRAYPRPDLVICLDAPGEVLYRRKPEASPDWLEFRRQQYLELATVLPNFVVVDVDRPLHLVLREIAALITDFSTREPR